MFQAEGELTWDSGRERFKTQRLDPSNGVLTTWEVNPVNKVSFRVDKLAIPGLEREVRDTEDNGGPFANQTRYSVKDERTPQHKHVSLTYYKEPGDMRVHTSLSHLGGGFDHFSAFYNTDGSPTTLMFQGNLLAGIHDEQFKEVKAKSYEDSFDELVEIAKINGLTAFFGPGGKFLFQNSKPNMDTIEFAASIGILTPHPFFGKISQEQRDAYLRTAGMVTERELEERYGHDPFIFENGTIISIGLTLETLNEFAEHPDLSVPFSDVAPDYFRRTINGLLIDHYWHLQRAGEVRVCYDFEKQRVFFGSNGLSSLDDEMNDDGKAPWKKIKEGDAFVLGEPVRHDTYDYTIRRGQANQLEVVIAKVLKPDVVSRLEFPETVDVQRTYEIVATQSNSGWEEALDQNPMSYYPQG